jgi:hypothetical protein
MNNSLDKEQIQDRGQVKHKQYLKTYVQFISICVLFIVFFFGIRTLIPNENITRLIIFPIFILTLILVVKRIKKMMQLRADIKIFDNIKAKNN